MSSVLMARRSTEVNARSNVRSASFMSRPASCASKRPRSERSTSFQPVNRFSLFHVLSPWRRRTTLNMELPQRRLAGVLRAGAELFFDPDQLVVLRDAIRPARRAGLDLAGARRHREIRDRRVFGFTRTVRDDAGVAGVARHADGVERLGDGADLIQLDENRVGDVLADAAREDL